MAAETTTEAPATSDTAFDAAEPANKTDEGKLPHLSNIAPPSNLLCNRELPIADIPEHPAFARNASAPSLQSFLHVLLTPALQMIDSTWPKQWTGGSEKSSKPASAKVKLYRWEDNRVDQTWFIRRSTHANIADAGTFTWEELDDGLRVDHSKKEAEYTPDIYQLVEICKWGPEQGLEGNLVEGFSEISMQGKRTPMIIRVTADELTVRADVYHQVVEIAHKLPAPLIPRAFAELVVTAKTGENGLIVVQVPVNIRKESAAFYSNDRNKEEGTSLQKRKVVILGSYVSIERARTTDKGVIEWTMGTVSDAKGALPMWIQRSQIGGAIAKDVGFFTKWAMEKRAST